MNRSQCAGNLAAQVSTVLLIALSLCVASAAHAEEPAASARPAQPDKLYFIDAHSQMPGGLDPNVIIPLMDKAGVWKTLLSARNDRPAEEVASYAAAHPQRIIAAVRTKGNAFNTNRPQYAEMLNNQLADPVFKAMGEVLLYHAQKGKKAPEIKVAASAPQTQMALDAAIQRGWPFIVHYEFAAVGNKQQLMDEFEALLRAHPQHPFLLIHMGQLDSEDVTRLIREHRNVYFITSHSNPINIAKNSGQPWTNLFEGETLAPDWRALIETHPDRFVLAFDNVWPEFWGDFYLKQAALWRKALAVLPPKVAHAVAHGNAERLWNIAPKVD